MVTMCVTQIIVVQGNSGNGPARHPVSGTAMDSYELGSFSTFVCQLPGLWAFLIFCDGLSWGASVSLRTGDGHLAGFGIHIGAYGPICIHLKSVHTAI